MALSTLFVDILLRLIIACVFVLLNALVIREIIVLFKNNDDTIMTATAVAFWIGVTLFFAGLLSDIAILGWIVAAFANLFFIFLYKRYYGVAWKESILMWE